MIKTVLLTAALTIPLTSYMTISRYTNILDERTQEVINLTSENEEILEQLRWLKEAKTDELTVSIPKFTVGVRNRNPANIVALSSKNPWLGQIGKDKRGHAIFETFHHGVRAHYLVIRNYYEKRGIDTLEVLTSRFCEGDHVRYAKFIAKELGVGYKDKINFIEHMPKIMKAMVRYENGFDVLPDYYYVPYTNK